MDIGELRSLLVERCRQLTTGQDAPGWWRDPILATARVDERFAILPRVAAPNHLLPTDLLPTARAVVVFMVPFTPELSLGNQPGKFPSPDWGLSLDRTNGLIGELSEYLASLFAGEGHRSELTPATYNFDPQTLTARWSHKHLGYLAGLGRFGVNAQLITPAGCAGRLGSLVTEAPLGDHPLVTEAELCLYKRGGGCLRCLRACPVGAVSVRGIDRPRCDRRIQVNRQRFAKMPGLGPDLEVCAKCVAGMPCHQAAPAPPTPA